MSGIRTQGAKAPCHDAFGLRFSCEFPLPELPRPAAPGPADVCVVLASDAAARGLFSGPAGPDAAIPRPQGDGSPCWIVRGIRGDRFFEYGAHATYHLSADHAVLTCAPVEEAAAPWRRFLLDTALGTASLVRGHEALHAGAVVGEDGVVAVTAGQGGGKSTLTIELVRRGLPLFCDDVLALSRGSDGVVGHPGPPLANLAPVLPDGTRAEEVGTVIAEVAGECWTAVERPWLAPARIHAVAVLDRRPDACGVSVADAIGPMRALLRSSLVSGVDPARVARRFDLLGDVADQARVVELRAGFDTPPGAVADALLDHLATPPPPGRAVVSRERVGPWT